MRHARRRSRPTRRRRSATCHSMRRPHQAAASVAASPRSHTPGSPRRTDQTRFSAADSMPADEATTGRRPLGVLHGLPVAHKDLVDTAGIRTTRGSPFYRDNVPTRDALIVTRIRAAGAITLGKTNTPEFGAGSQTFNTVFGATRNPYDLTKTCGGSSGGAAVSLACGLVPIADGSDTGGALPKPAAFCNIVGFRPSPGRVPTESGSWSPLSVSGPMARSVADVALF